MKRTVLVMAAAALIVLGTGAPTAWASFRTTITHVSTVALGGGDYFVGGRVTSRFLDCVYPRRVKVKAKRPGHAAHLVETDQTSAGGAWSAIVHVKGRKAFVAKAARSYPIPNAHRRSKSCAPDHARFTVVAP